MIEPIWQAGLQTATILNLWKNVRIPDFRPFFPCASSLIINCQHQMKCCSCWLRSQNSLSLCVSQLFTTKDWLCELIIHVLGVKRPFLAFTELIHKSCLVRTPPTPTEMLNLHLWCEWWIVYIWAFRIMYDLAYRGDTFFLFTFKCNGGDNNRSNVKNCGD